MRLSDSGVGYMRRGKRYKILPFKCERVKMFPSRLLHRLSPTPPIHSFTPNGSQMITQPKFPILFDLSSKKSVEISF